MSRRAPSRVINRPGMMFVATRTTVIGRNAIPMY